MNRFLYVLSENWDIYRDVEEMYPNVSFLEISPVLIYCAYSSCVMFTMFRMKRGCTQRLG
jgi:hypothetical protein